MEACVVGYCEEEWKRFKQKIDNMKLSYKEKAALRREFIGRAVEVSFDKQGRITLPVDLLKYAHLKDVSEVVVMGCDNTIEFWNPELYESNQAEAEEIVQRVMGENYFD